MEFLAVDTETNGRAGDLCELTEVGCVLVGGGELHEQWSSLVRVERPLSRGIQRFTGITQAMVDDAPPPEEVLPLIAEQLRRRVLVAHNASFDRRVLKQAFERAGDRVARPARPVHGRDGPPVRAARAPAQARAARRVARDRGRRDPPRAAGRAHVRADLLRALPQAVRERGVARRRAAPARPAAAAVQERAPPPKIPREQRPDLSKLPDDPGVYVFRNEAGQPLYVGKSVAVKSRARAHFCQPGEWTGQAEVVDYIPTNSELGALILENRLIKRWKPTGQPGAQANRPLGVPRLPARHPLPRARGGPRAGGRAAR